MLSLLLLLACDDRDKGDDSGLPDSDSPVDTGEPPDPLPRREGQLSLADAEARVLGAAGDGLGTAAAGGPGAWRFAVGVSQRGGGVGGAAVFAEPPAGDLDVAGAVAQIPGGTEQSYAGSSLEALDGALAVGAFWDGSGGSLAGAVYLWTDPANPGEPAAIWMGDSGDNAGISVRSVGDWTGDGVPDLAVGAIGVDGREGEAGRVSVVDGATRGEARLADAGAAVWGLDYAGYFGVSVSAGDLDGDGVLDLFVGGMAESGDAASSGVARVFYGPVRQQLDTRDADAALFGEESNAMLGKSVSCAGDLDGDGLADLAVGAQDGGDGGFVYVHTAVPAGVAGVREGVQAVIAAEAPNDRLGFSVAIVGDRDLDGRDELFIGAPRNSGGGEYAGAAYLFYGPPEGIPSAADADWRLVGEAAQGRAGTFVGALPDFNEDHAPELAVGAYGLNDGSGALYLLY